MKKVHPYVYAGLNHHKPTEGAIIENVCHVLKISTKIVLGKERTRDVVEARQLAMYFLRKNQALPYSAIGKMFQKDHATVIHACRQVENLLSYHIEFRKKYFKVASYIANFDSIDVQIEVTDNKNIVWKEK